MSLNQGCNLLFSIQFEEDLDYNISTRFLVLICDISEILASKFTSLVIKIFREKKWLSSSDTKNHYFFLSSSI